MSSPLEMFDLALEIEFEDIIRCFDFGKTAVSDRIAYLGKLLSTLFLKSDGEIVNLIKFHGLLGSTDMKMTLVWECEKPNRRII